MTISFSLSLPSGWSKHRQTKWFSSYFDRKISANKAFEWQTDYFGWTSLFRFELDLIPTGSDHAAIGFDITIFGFMVAAKIYDSRHWDWETNTWERYDEESQKIRYDDEVAQAESRLREAYRLVERDKEHKAKLARDEFLKTPEGIAETAAEAVRVKEEKRLRGEEYRRRNLEAKDDV